MYKPSRREFLEQSMLAAAAAVTVGASRAAPAFERSNQASERLPGGCVGVRGRGGEHVNEYTRRKDTEIVAIVDVDEGVGNAKAEAIAQKQGTKPTVYKDMRKAFEDKSINIVSIATPNHWHSLAAIWAI